MKVPNKFFSPLGKCYLRPWQRPSAKKTFGQLYLFGVVFGKVLQVFCQWAHSVVEGSRKGVQTLVESKL